MAFVLQGPLPAGQAAVFLQQPADDPCLSRNCGATIATLFGETWGRRGGRIVVPPGRYRMHLLGETGGAEVTLRSEAGPQGDGHIDLNDPVEGQVRTLATSRDAAGTFRGAAVLSRPGLVAAAVRSSRVGGARTALEACRYSPDSHDETAYGPGCPGASSAAGWVYTGNGVRDWVATASFDSGAGEHGLGGNWNDVSVGTSIVGTGLWMSYAQREAPVASPISVSATPRWLRLLSGRARVRRKALWVRVRCEAADPCRGRATSPITRKRTFSVAANRKRLLRLPLRRGASRRSRTRLVLADGHHRVSATLRVR